MNEHIRKKKPIEIIRTLQFNIIILQNIIAPVLLNMRAWGWVKATEKVSGVKKALVGYHFWY